MGAGGKKSAVAPANAKKKKKKGNAPSAADTQVVIMHGMAFHTVVDNAGVGRLRQTAWGSDAPRKSESAALALEAGVDRKERQFHILEPIYDGKGWKHKNVGTYPEYIPEELEGVLPEDDYEYAARNLNAKAEALTAKLLNTVVTRGLLFLSSFALLLPHLLALPRIQYEPPPPNATELAGIDRSAELNDDGEEVDPSAVSNSTNATCVNCVPENKVSVIIEYEPMELEDWIILASFAGAFVLVQIFAQVWSRVKQARLWKQHRFELSAVCATATKEAGLRRLTGTAVHWKPQPHLRPLQEGGAHVKTDALEGQHAAQMRVDGRYAILVDWRGVSGDEADKTAQLAKAQAHKREMQKQAVLAAGGIEAVAAMKAKEEKAKQEKKARKEAERER